MVELRSAPCEPRAGQSLNPAMGRAGVGHARAAEAGHGLRRGGAAALDRLRARPVPGRVPLPGQRCAAGRPVPSGGACLLLHSFAGKLCDCSNPAVHPKQLCSASHHPHAWARTPRLQHALFATCHCSAQPSAHIGSDLTLAQSLPLSARRHAHGKGAGAVRRVRRGARWAAGGAAVERAAAERGSAQGCCRGRRGARQGGGGRRGRARRGSAGRGAPAGRPASPLDCAPLRAHSRLPLAAGQQAMAGHDQNCSAGKACWVQRTPQFEVFGSQRAGVHTCRSCGCLHSRPPSMQRLRSLAKRCADSRAPGAAAGRGGRAERDAARQAGVRGTRRPHVRAHGRPGRLRPGAGGVAEPARRAALCAVVQAVRAADCNAALTDCMLTQSAHCVCTNVMRYSNLEDMSCERLRIH